VIIATARSSGPALLEQVRQTARKREADDGAAYLALVKRCAAGEEVDSDRVLELLAAADKDPADFQTDFEAAAARIEWRALASKLPRLTAEKAAVGEKVRATDAELEAAIQAAHAAHAEKVAPLDEAAAEAGGPPGEILAFVAWGMERELREVFGLVRTMLEEIAEDEDDADAE
jgi:hypothetical protein